MASARTLTTNELGTIRYEQAEATGKWPIEVRLIPQLNDTADTTYTLHTAGNAAVIFTSTSREEVRATLAVPPGALVYEVLRDGVLVSTGGLEVRPPDALQQTSGGSDSGIGGDDVGAGGVDGVFGAHLGPPPPSGAMQLVAGKPPPDQCWPVAFAYNEMAWMAREVTVVNADTGAVLLVLTRKPHGFGAIGVVPVGCLRYRFRVVPFEMLHAQAAMPTRLGWDDGAMIHAWQLMTWPLFLHVADLCVPGAVPADGLVRSPGAGAECADADDADGEGDAPSDGGAITDVLPEDEDEDEDEDEHRDDASRASTTDKPFDKDALRWRDKLQFDHHVADVADPAEVAKECVPTRRPGGNGFGLFAMGVVMFFLGSTVTLLLGRGGGEGFDADDGPGRRKLDSDDDDARAARNSSGVILKHQRGVSF